MTDEDDWLEGLRGRPRAGSDPKTLWQAEAVRAAIEAGRIRPEQAAPDNDVELQRLLFRLRREGLLDSKPRWRVPLAAAAAVLVAVAVSLQLPAPPDDGPMRGAGVPQVEHVANVAARVSELRATLEAVGAPVVVTPLSGGGQEVAATVPSPSLDEAGRRLAALGLKPPATDGTFRVEVRPR
jgi:negative regulator of sigma E activity